MFDNTLITALVTLKTMVDRQSAWGSSLKGVFVAVQCMRQYTENSPGCVTAKYTNVGGRRQYTTQCWKPLLDRWTVTDRIGTVTDRIRKPLLDRWTVTDRIGTVTDRIGTVTVCIGTATGRIGTQTTVRLSRYIDLYHSLCNRRHTLTVLPVFFLKKPEPIH